MNHDKFKAAVLPHRKKLYQIARKMLNDEQDAEDAVQEVLLRLWHTRDSLSQYNSIAAYATTMTKNLCIDRLRIRNRYETMDASFQERVGNDNPYMQVERQNTEEVLLRIIKTLPPLQQAIIQMKDVEEYEVDQIAAITGTQPEAVRVNLSRARKKVREEYVKWMKVYEN